MHESLWHEIEQAHTPVHLQVPNLEITPSECNCCWEWFFEESKTHITPWYGPSNLQEMWDLLWDWVDPNLTPGDDVYIDLNGDQREGWAVFRAVSTHEIEVGVKSQYAGPPEYLHFRCERAALIDRISACMQHYVRHPQYKHHWDALEQMEQMAIAATAPEWPWAMFPLWYTHNHSLTRTQMQWLIFTTLDSAPQFSQLNAHKKDPIDDLLIQCYWNTFLLAQLPEAAPGDTEYRQQLQAYAQESQAIFAFAIEMDMRWRNNCVYNAEDPLTNYYDHHRTYLELTSQAYLARLRWWLAHLKYTFRRTHPAYYDWDSWEHRKGWETRLEKTHPELAQQFGLKWRQNAIWKASFGEQA